MIVEPLSSYREFASGVAANMYPGRLADVPGWLREHVGIPEFEWDHEAVFAGFHLPMREFCRDRQPLDFGAVCAMLVAAAGEPPEEHRPIVEMAEHCCHAALAVEQLVLRNHEAGRMQLRDAHHGAVEGQIAAHLLSSSMNRVLRHPAYALRPPVANSAFSHAKRESLRALYFLAMQLSWTRIGVVSPERAASYAVYGPLASTFRLAVVTCAHAIEPLYRDLDGLVALLDDAAYIATTLHDLGRFAAGDGDDADFRVGKVTPLTVAAAHHWRLPIRKIPALSSGFTRREMLEEPMRQCIRDAERALGRIGDKLKGVPPSSPRQSLYAAAAQEIQECRRVLNGLADA